MKKDKAKDALTLVINLENAENALLVKKNKNLARNLSRYLATKRKIVKAKASTTLCDFQ